MAMLYTIADTLECEDDEHQIRKGIDNLGSVWGSIVILKSLQQVDSPNESPSVLRPLHTNLWLM